MYISLLLPYCFSPCLCFLFCLKMNCYYYKLKKITATKDARVMICFSCVFVFKKWIIGFIQEIFFFYATFHCCLIQSLGLFPLIMAAIR